MSKKDGELDDKELGSLLSDLSSRGDTAPKRTGGAAPKRTAGAAPAAAGDDGEDIEAFLKSLEGDDYRAPDPAPTAVAEKDDPFAEQFAALGAIQPDDLPATTEKSAGSQKPGKKEKGAKQKKPSRKERAAQKKAAKEAEKRAKAEEKKAAKEASAAGQTRGKRALKKTAKLALVSFPALLFSWLLGAFLGHLISAGWLIAILALLVGFGLPLLVCRVTQRGKYAWWTLGIGLLMSVALTAPTPNTAADTLTRYGHWPATAITEVAGWQPDNALVQFNAASSKLLGGVLGTGAAGAGGPRELGTVHPLYPPEPGTTTPGTPTSPGTTGDVPTGTPPPVDPGNPPAPTEPPPAD